MNANLVTEDKLTAAVAQIDSSIAAQSAAIAAQSADIRELTATMESGFRASHIPHLVDASSHSL